MPPEHTERYKHHCAAFEHGERELRSVLASGNTPVTPIDPNSAGTLPGGFAIFDNLAFDVSTTATVTPPIQVCFNVPGVTDASLFATLRVLHNEGGTLVDRTILAPDSPAPDFASGNICARVSSLSPFVIAQQLAIPTPTPTPTPTPVPQLTALGPGQVWIGLKNSDDVGTKFDILAEVLKNGVVVGSGQLNSVPGGSSGFNNAVVDTINIALSAPTPIHPGDSLGIRLSVRIAATGHRSGTARLWFNDASANSRFSGTIGGTTDSYFLLSSFALAPSAGAGPKNTIDVLVDRAVGENPFKPFGTWSRTF